MTPGFINEASHRPRHLIPWTSSGVMHSGYIDLILVTSGLSRRRCPLHFLQGGDITADLPHNHHHPPLCSLGNPLIPTVISFVVARLSLARTASHHSSFVLWGFWETGQGRWGLLDPRMCNVLPGRLPGERMDPAPSFNWSHILGLKHAEIEKESVEGDLPLSNPHCFTGEI